MSRPVSRTPDVVATRFSHPATLRDFVWWSGLAGVSVQVVMYGALGRGERRAVQDAAERYAAFLELQVSVQFQNIQPGGRRWGVTVTGR